MELTVADALIRVSTLVERVFAEVSREYGLTPQQVHVLCVVNGGPVGMTELAHSLGLEKSSATGLVDRVVRRGLVDRAPDSQDRRACRIMLTDEGSWVAQKAHDEVVARLEALAGELPQTDRNHLVSMLARLTGAGRARTRTGE